jgi:hypothetical protein
MSRKIAIYGLMGFTHGWANVLTVMSPDGASAALTAVDAGDDVIVQAGEGRLTQYRAKRSGALERLIAEYGIIVLAKPEWDARKQELGEAVYR